LDYLTTHTSLSPIRRGFAPGFVTKKGAHPEISRKLETYSSYIVAVRFIGGGNWRTWRKPLQVTNKLYHNVVHLALIEIRTHNSGDRH